MSRAATESRCQAEAVRLRPILMTSLALVMALVPMAIGWRGAEANAPLARAIIGGALSAAILSLVVVPCLYMTFKRSRDASVGDRRTLES